MGRAHLQAEPRIIIAARRVVDVRVEVVDVAADAARGLDVEQVVDADREVDAGGLKLGLQRS